MTTPETLIAQLDGAALQLELDARDDTIAEMTARIDAALAVHTRLAHPLQSDVAVCGHGLADPAYACGNFFFR